MHAFWTLFIQCGAHSLRSLVAERQTCNLKVLGSIPSEGFYGECLFKSANLTTLMRDPLRTLALTKI